MYIGLLHLHNFGRWLVLLAAVVAIVIAVLGLVRGAPWGRGAKLSGLAYLVMMDTQLLIGLVLYGVSPRVREAMSNVAVAMADSERRFILVEHFALMIVAVALVHVGYALSKRASTAKAAYTRSSIFYTLGLVAVLAGIPWWRPLFPGA